MSHTEHLIAVSTLFGLISMNLNGGMNVIFELSWLENPANTYMSHTEHWIAVSTLFGLISINLNEGIDVIFELSWLENPQTLTRDIRNTE